MTVRTQDQIAAAAHKFINSGSLMAEQVVPLLLEELDYAHARDWLKPGATMLEWDESRGDAAAREGRRVEVFEHACLKAADHRGISASIGYERAKMIAWLHSDELYVKANSAPYPNYGAPVLLILANALGGRYAEVFQEQDRLHTGALSNMAVGQQCEPECMEGCG